MNRAEGAAHLSEQVQRNQRVAEAVSAADPEPLARLQTWQRARLRETYSDMRQQSRYRDACEFFLEELYGGRDVHDRDRQLARVVPVMRQFLPGELLYAVGEALRLQAMSLELDLALSGMIESPIDQPACARAYRALGEWQLRREQIVLIGELGMLLGQTVHKPFVRGLVRMMGGPAMAAGFGVLQGFLERGLDAFAKMGDARPFVDVIVDRETRALDAIEGGADWPFEPWIGRGPAEASIS